MSATTPLTPVPQTGGYDLPAIALDAPAERVGSRRGQLAIAGLLLSGSLIAVAATRTGTLLPESIRPVAPGALAGAFRGIGLNIHTSGAIGALVALFTCYALVVAASGQLSPRLVL